MIRAVFIALVVLLCGSVKPAHALLCSISISNLSFNTVDVLSGTTVDTTASASISCAGVPFTTTRVCLNINSGSGGADGSGRYMSNGANLLRFQIYQDAGYSSVWGSATWGLGGSPQLVDVPLNVLGNGSANVTLYGRVFGGQSAAPSGAYSSTFNGAQLSLPYLSLALFDCNNILGQSPLFAAASFTASANVVNNCAVTAQNINFGSHGVLNANVDRTGEVSVTCTPATNYTISLSNGMTGTSPTARKMTKGAESVTYGLYRDAGRSQAWGSTIGYDTVAGSGTGSAQNYPVYGRVAPQATPTSGTYGDVITVTIAY